MRRSMRTICWMPGIRITRPGPLTRQKRPSWNTTPRWYSRRMRSELASTRTQQDQDRRMPIGMQSSRALLPSVAASAIGLTSSVRPSTRVMRTRWPARSGCAARTRQRSPSTAAHPSPPPNSMTSPTAPIMRCVPLTHRPPPRLRRHAGDADDERGRDERHAGDQRRRNAEARHVAVDQQQRAERERRHAADAERAVAGHEGLGDEEADAQQDQRQAGVVDRQHLQRPRARAAAQTPPITPGATKPGFMNSNSRP